MAVIYGQIHVDEKYKATLEPNLYHKTPFADGKTFTSKYEEGAAGGIFVRKLGTSTVEVGTPGRDFVDEASRDDLIPVVFNNNYQKSKKIYGVQAAAVSTPLANESLKVANEEVSESWTLSGLACLINEGKAATATDAITAKTVKQAVIAVRKEIVAAKGSADVVLCSPELYAAILEQAGSEFVPQSNEFTNATGQIGKWLGCTFYEVSALAEAQGKYYDSANALKTVPFAKVDFIMYNHEALSIIPNFSVARIVDSENFAGSKAQVELNSAFKVTNQALVRVRKHV